MSPGASAVEEILKKHPRSAVRVIAVWQPMLATDWSPPNTGVLARLSDSRVRQYWDKDHVLARRLANDARPPQPTQSCCLQENILWDLAAVYPKGAQWKERMPPATIFEGPVVDASQLIESTIAR